MKRCKGPPPWLCIIFEFTVVTFEGLPSLKACRQYLIRLVENQAWMMCACCARTCACAVWAHLCMEHEGTPLPRTCCARTPSNKCGKLHCAVHVKQLGWGGACTCKQGCISTGGEHPRRLTWLSRTFHRTPLLLWPLPLNLLVMLQSSDGWPERNVQFCYPALQKKSPGKFLWCTPSAEASGPFQHILEFSGVKDWDGGAILAQGFFHSGAGMWERSHLPHPLRKKMQGCGQGCY